MKIAAITILIIAVLIGGALVLAGNKGSNNNVQPTANNVSVIDGQQIIEIKAKGGYLPRKSVAQAGLPTTLRFNTNGTFDCSSSVRIPSLNISKLLPPSGTIDIDLGSPQAATLQGMCGMGMYLFEIDFRN